MRSLAKWVVLTASLVLGALSTGASVASAQSITERVLRDGKITIGIANNAPWGFLGADGKVVGIHPDLLRVVLEPAGVKEIDFVLLDWGALIPSLTSRRIDAISSGMAITPQRCDQLIFSNPDLAVGIGVLVLPRNPHNIHRFEDVLENPDLRIGAARGSTEAKSVLAAGIPKDRVLLLQDSQGVVAALLSGRINAYAASSVSLINALKDPNLDGKVEYAVPFTGLIENGREQAFYPAIEFRPDDAKLRDIYNEGLAKRKADGTLQRILEKYSFGDVKIAPPDVTAKSLCPDNYK